MVIWRYGGGGDIVMMVVVVVVVVVMTWGYGDGDVMAIW